MRSGARSSWFGAVGAIGLITVLLAGTDSAWAAFPGQWVAGGAAVGGVGDRADQCQWAWRAVCMPSGQRVSVWVRSEAGLVTGWSGTRGLPRGDSVYGALKHDLFGWKLSRLRLRVQGSCRCRLHEQPHAAYCQWPSVSPRLRPSFLPSRGHVFSPLVAIKFPDYVGLRLVFRSGASLLCRRWPARAGSCLVLR
jgi:hypothetical protein